MKEVYILTKEWCDSDGNWQTAYYPLVYENEEYIKNEIDVRNRPINHFVRGKYGYEKIELH